jgi:hypothetical protein
MSWFKAVNHPIVRRNKSDAATRRRGLQFPPSRDRGGKGQKSYWERFHGDVTLKCTWRGAAKCGAGRNACFNDFREDSNDNGCNGGL